MHQRLARWVQATTLLTLFLVSVGGFVRVSGAGLGCPDWPKCFGRYIPPMSAEEVPETFDRSKFNVVETWTEYINRLVGVMVGITMVVATVLAVAGRRSRAAVESWLIIATLLTGYQGWLGGQVVAAELHPRVVTAHYLVALAILFCLLEARGRLSPRWNLPESEMTTRLRRTSLSALVVVLLQVVLGTLVRGALEYVALDHPELPADERLTRIPILDALHRTAALAVFIALIRIFRATESAAGALGAPRRLAVLALAFAVLQGILGAWMAYGGLPAVAQWIHMSVGSWIPVVLYILVRKSRGIGLDV